MTEQPSPDQATPPGPVGENRRDTVQDTDERRSGAPPQADHEDQTANTSPEITRFWEAVKRLPSYAKLATAMLRDPEVPNSAKGVLGLGGGYLLSPVDLVPGIIPVAGQMDDMYAILIALQQSLKRMPDDLAQKHLDANGVTREHIDDDLAAVRDLAKMAVVKTVKFGGKALGRFSRAALKFANNQLERRDARRGATTRE